MEDWFNKHQDEKFITPLAFQNIYPQWDKYINESFRKPFYSYKKKLKEG